jgi:hypothetical protein
MLPIVEKLAVVSTAELASVGLALVSLLLQAASNRATANAVPFFKLTFMLFPFRR